MRALTVDPERAALPSGVEVAVGSIARPGTVPLDGVEAVYLAPYARTASRVCELIRESGVRRVVALSGSSVGDEHEGSSGHEFAAVERAVDAAGLARTFLRPGAFMGNTFGWAEAVRERGEVRSAYPEAVQTSIDLGDIAAVAAHTLTTEGHEGRTYVLSGPEGLTMRQKAEAIGVALGRKLSFVELTPDEQVAEWRAQGIPATIAGWLLEGYAQVAAQPEVPTGVVERLLGRPGVGYREWAKANAAAFG
ncbi:NAD(P)H-binding protein [Amycolatopsis panacis]|uniref:NAD(P)H-binding protein n=1 Tax=Amycolatopsis panacis TaxID=2340917 RepID=UPI001F29684F|nr:NAD(P)H-binding protein [Amycolatopsis panacis]